MTPTIKIAYLMHVDWDWIKQRPHFLYEELTKYYSVDLYYIQKLYNKRKHLVSNKINTYSKSMRRKIFKIPKSAKYKFIQAIEKTLNYPTIELLKEYDCIWITSPILMDFLPLELLKEKTVIYDCMDDFLGFFSVYSEKEKKRLIELESQLLRCSKYVITTSMYLKKKLMREYGDDLINEPIVINNGITDGFFHNNIGNIINIADSPKANGWNIHYIGTIGEWFDFDLIIDMLIKYPLVTATVIGPIDVLVKKRHPRLQLLGSVEHHMLPVYAKRADAFIMPFKLTELVRAVDPVKIYEYISFNKPVIAVSYEEMHKFHPFVNLYSSDKEFFSLVDKLVENKLPNYRQEDVDAFLRENSWSKRAEQACEVITDAVESIESGLNES
ncbi:hypothetical protein [Paenibacillus sp. 2KB_22]|uniref:hypothetical protein n=1 Tax=Paenibacillus sp. 2KB_22 TaxID=3232978 RepID=UPI003F97E237